LNKIELLKVEVSLYTNGGIAFPPYEECQCVFLTAFSEWIGKSGKTKTNLLSAFGKKVHDHNLQTYESGEDSGEDYIPLSQLLMGKKT
jgi:hypothetical protein